MSLIESLRWRYATKQFDPERVVPDEHVNQILTAGNLAPTSYGLQPYRFIVIRNPELQEQLVPYSFNQLQVVEASHVIVIATRTDLNAEYIDDYAARIESTRDLKPGTVHGYRQLMVGTIERMPPDELDHWNAKQAYIALGMMMSAAAMLGVDTCPMEGFVPDKYDEILGLGKQQLRSVVALPIGYRATGDKSQHEKKVRLPLSEIVISM